MNDITKKGEQLQKMMDEECCPISFEDEDINLSGYKKIPLASFASVGAGLSSLSTAMGKILQTVPPNTEETLYRAVFKNGISGTLVDSKDGIGKLGTIMKDGGGIAQARWVPVEPGKAYSNTVVPMDPTALFMAMALMSMSQQLGNIQELQEDMMDYLRDRDAAQQRGDLNTLMDIMNTYKYNWNNDLYKQNKHNLVQEIRREAEQNIPFHQKQIERRIKKQSFIHSGENADKMISAIQRELKEYQIAVYLYAFSDFLEIMLLGNFESGYLKDSVEKIEDYSYQYRELYTKIYDQIEKYADTTVQSVVRKGLAGVNCAAGKAIAKIPVISRGQIDEHLIEAGDKLRKDGKKKARKKMRRITAQQSACVLPFVRNIEEVDRLYNSPMELALDCENLYLRLSN